MAKKETRAARCGLHHGTSPKALASRAKRKLATLRKQLEEISEPFTDIDNTVEVELDELLAHFDEFRAKLDDTAAWLLEEVCDE